jgi:hypothetical protein
MVDFEGRQTEARVLHIGRGKFRILEGMYAGKIIDASDIVNCSVQRQIHVH